MTGFSLLVVEHNVGRGLVAAKHYEQQIRDLTSIQPEGECTIVQLTMPPALEFPDKYQVICLDYPLVDPGISDVMIMCNVGISGIRVSNADLDADTPDTEALEFMRGIGALSTVIGQNPSDFFGRHNHTQFFVMYRNARKTLRDNMAKGNRSQLKVV